jgi:hypothetical protein
MMYLLLFAIFDIFVFSWTLICSLRNKFVGHVFDPGNGMKLNDNFKNIDICYTGVLSNDVFTSIQNILEFLWNIILYLKIG